MDDKLQSLINGMIPLAHSDNAAKMSSYMKEKVKFLGIKSQLRKKVLSDWRKSNEEYIRVNFRTVALSLYNLEYREFHYCGMELMTSYHTKLHEKDIQLIENMILMNSWWDTVDLLASYCVGSIFRNRQLRDIVTERWMTSGNIWLKRSCIISQLKYKEDTDLPYLFALIDGLVDSNEFFIQKANGWALRQASKYYPSEIRKYVDSKTDWPRVTYREAVKYL